MACSQRDLHTCVIVPHCGPQQQQEEAEQRSLAAQRTAISEAIATANNWQQLRAILYNYSPGYSQLQLNPVQLAAVLRRLPHTLRNGVTLTWRQRGELSEMLEALSALLVEALTQTGERQLTLAPGDIAG